jgi:inner membrane protein
LYDARVDNLTHTLCGLALGRAGLDRAGRWALPTLAVAANLPDVEGAWQVWGGKAGYLAHHRGLTHSVVGMAIGTLALASIVWLWRRRREPARFATIALVTAIGVASHFALDWLNTYGVRPWLPFSDRWFYGDVLFIVDPWMWLALGVPLWLGAPWRPRVEATIVAIALVSSAMIANGVAGGLAPWPVAAVWLAIVAAVAATRVVRRSPLRPRIAMVVGWAVLAAYLAWMLAASRTAAARALDAAAMPGAKACASATPAVPWRFTVAVSDGVEARAYRVDLASDEIALVDRIATHADDPRLDAIHETREFAAWRIFARLPIAEFEGGAALLGDARYRFAGRAGDWTTLRVPLP